jgi:hypothetical protein
MLTVEHAAIKDHDGTVYVVARPGRHHHVIRLMVDSGCKKPVTGEQGFVLSDGRFADREEAARIALESGQIVKLKWGPTDLFSEDLW